MKKILEFFKNWFERNGLIKIIIAFIVLAVAVALGRKFENLQTIFGWIVIISGGYLLLTFLVFFIAGIVNSINDIRKNRNEKENTEE